MIPRAPLLAVLRLALCLLAALAIVLLPPSALHALEAGPGSHHAAASEHLSTDAAPDHGAHGGPAAEGIAPLAETLAATVGPIDADVPDRDGVADAGTAPCCGGVCLSAILASGQVHQPLRAVALRYAASDTTVQTSPVPGFLRPPQA